MYKKQKKQIQNKKTTGLKKSMKQKKTAGRKKAAKYKKYAGGKIVNFVQENIPEIHIDSTTLAVSYRNNQIICNFRIFGHCVQYTRSCITLRAV